MIGRCTGQLDTLTYYSNVSILYQYDSDSAQATLIPDRGFIINSKYDSNNAYIVDLSGMVSHSTCQSLGYKRLNGKNKLNHSIDKLYCQIDTNVYMYSMRSGELKSEGYGDIEIYNDTLYLAFIGDSIQLMHVNKPAPLVTSSIGIESWKNKYWNEYNYTSQNSARAKDWHQKNFMLTIDGKYYGLNNRNDREILPIQFESIRLWNSRYLITSRNNIDDSESSDPDETRFEVIYSIYDTLGNLIVSSYDYHINTHGNSLVEIKEQNGHRIVLDGSLDTIYNLPYDGIRYVSNNRIIIEVDDKKYLTEWRKLSNKEKWTRIVSGQYYNSGFYSITGLDGEISLYNSIDEKLYSSNDNEVRFKQLLDNLIIIDRGFRDIAVMNKSGVFIHGFGDIAISENRRLKGYFVKEGRNQNLFNANSEIIAEDIAKAGYAKENYYYTLRKNGYVGLLDSSGNLLLPYIFDKINIISVGFVNGVIDSQSYLIKIEE